MTTKPERPPLPDPLKRLVRQRCGFGCVICGCPIYEIDHIYGYEDGVVPPAEELTLLCDHHHKLKTHKLLPLGQVLAADKDPINVRMGVSAPQLLPYWGSECTTILGTNVFYTRDEGQGTFIMPLVIDDAAMIGFDLIAQRLTLNLSLFEEYNRPILLVVQNEIVYSANEWDIEWERNHLTVRRAPGDILLRVRFSPGDGRIEIDRGRFLFDGVEVEVFKDRVELNTSTVDDQGKPKKSVLRIIGYQAQANLGLHFGLEPSYPGLGGTFFRVSREQRNFAPWTRQGNHRVPPRG